jgi:hypothetical protein
MRRSTFSSLKYLAASCVVTAIAAVPAFAAPTTFAQFIQQDGAMQEWTVTTSGNQTTVTASGPVDFSFSGIPGLPFSGPELATFTLTATSNSLGACGVSCGAGDSLTQAGYTGTFSFTDAGVVPGANLLSGIFSVQGNPATTGAQFSSHVGSSGASFNASATAGNLGQLVMASAFAQFIGTTSENASFSLSSLIPDFATAVVTNNQAYPAPGPFTGSGTSTFSSSPAPVSAPEPSALALFGSGLFGMGLLVRRKTTTSKMA